MYMAVLATSDYFWYILYGAFQQVDVIYYYYSGYMFYIQITVWL